MLVALKHHCNLGHHLQGAFGESIQISMPSAVRLLSLILKLMYLYYLSPALRKHNQMTSLGSKVSKTCN